MIHHDPELAGYLAKVRETNLDALTDILGLQKESRGYQFEFFNRSILFDGTDFKDLSGAILQPALIGIFCRYILNAPADLIQPSGRLVTFREFSGSAPLFSRFAENTNKTIEQTFANRVEILRKKCAALLGIPTRSSSHDLSVHFKALPRVPLILKFNDADEMLPADSSLLFCDDAARYLDIKSLAAICTYLTGILIQ